MSEEDEVSESVELAWETGFQRGLAKGREGAKDLLQMIEQYEAALEHSEARIAALEEALRPFAALKLFHPMEHVYAARAALRAELAPLKEKNAETDSSISHSVEDSS